MVIFKAFSNICAADAAPGLPLSDPPCISEEEASAIEAIAEQICAGTRQSDTGSAEGGSLGGFAAVEELVVLADQLASQLHIVLQKFSSLDLEPL